MKSFLFFLFFLSTISSLFTSCCQMSNSDCNLRTVPVTNNPNALGGRQPSSGASF